MTLTLSKLDVNIPLSSYERTHLLATKQQIRAVLLAPSASPITKWEWFQQDLARAGIASDLLVNRGTTWRKNEIYSFLGMKDDLLETLVAVRKQFPDEKVVLSATCLSSIVLALALQDIHNQKLVDGMIMGVPISSLYHIAHLYKTDFIGLRQMYKHGYGLDINENEKDFVADISPLQLLSQTPHEAYKPFIYFNRDSKYLSQHDKDIYFEGVIWKQMRGIVLESKKDPLNPFWHDIAPENLPSLQAMSIAYMKETSDSNE